jgi:hypothetical protein
MVVQPLADIGVCGPGVLDELSTYTLDEIAAICQQYNDVNYGYENHGL